MVNTGRFILNAFDTALRTVAAMQSFAFFHNDFDAFSSKLRLVSINTCTSRLETKSSNSSRYGMVTADTAENTAVEIDRESSIP